MDTVLHITLRGMYGDKIEGQSIKFKCNHRYCEGVPYMDLSEKKAEVMLAKTARKRFEIYTKYEVEIAKLAHGLQGMINHTSEK